MLRNAKMKLHSLTTLRPAKNLPEDKQTITTTKKKTKPKKSNQKKKKRKIKRLGHQKGAFYQTEPG